MDMAGHYLATSPCYFCRSQKENEMSTDSTAGKSTLDRPIPKPTEVNESLYALLFAEAVRHSYQRVDNVSGLETKFAGLGSEVGWRASELVASWEKVDKGEVRIVQALQHVTGSCWTALYGKAQGSPRYVRSGIAKVFVQD